MQTEKSLFSFIFIFDADTLPYKNHTNNFRMINLHGWDSVITGAKCSPSEPVPQVTVISDDCADLFVW